MNKKAIRQMKFFMLIFIIYSSICGCSNSQNEIISQVADSEGEYTIFYPDDDRTKLYSYVYESDTNDESELIDELLKQLEKGDYEGAQSPVILKELGEVGSSIDSKGLLTLHFSAAYQSLSGTDELLSRAAIVKTLCQLELVQCVEFYVNEKSLVLDNGTVIIEKSDSLITEIQGETGSEVQKGETVGIMTDYDFVNNIGSEENAIQKDMLTLYYANEEGNLLESSYVSVEYDATVSLEELVVMQLIDGPVTDKCFKSINSDTKINKVSTKDKICYVDLSKEFLEVPEGTGMDVAIYSIVNSLTELNNISKVQVSVEGNIITDYSEDGLLERNLNLLDSEG